MPLSPSARGVRDLPSKRSANARMGATFISGQTLKGVCGQAGSIILTRVLPLCDLLVFSKTPTRKTLNS